jgi:NADPH:quinone reductase-like Zn-dependent oxidoreductase
MICMQNTKVLVTKYGGPEVLEVIEDLMPEPAQGEVRIKIFVAGVALADTMRREGVYPGTPAAPFTPGYDLVGVIEALGKDVPPEWMGRKVAALLDGIGGYAQYICLPLEELVVVPPHVDSSSAVCLILNYVTAFQMLHRIAKVKEGDRILIHGAAGGTGSALLELGKLANLTMFGTASVYKHEHLYNYNAIPIDYKSEDFVERVLHAFPEGIEAVFDHIGGDNWLRSFEILNTEGIFVGYGFTSILSDTKNMDSRQSLLTAWQTIAEAKKTPQGNKAILYSMTTLKQLNLNQFKDDLSQLFEYLAEKKLNPTIAKTFPLKEVNKAHDYAINSAGVGKIILVCNVE